MIKIFSRRDRMRSNSETKLAGKEVEEEGEKEEVLLHQSNMRKQTFMKFALFFKQAGYKEDSFPSHPLHHVTLRYSVCRMSSVCMCMCNLASVPEQHRVDIGDSNEGSIFYDLDQLSG